MFQPNAMEVWEADGGPAAPASAAERQQIMIANPTENPKLTMAQQIAKAASTFQKQRTGLAPKRVTVVLNEDTLVVTLHDALSPAEKALALTPAGAAQVREFHRQLFANSAEPLREEIKRITGVDVRQATAEVETTTGTVVQVFTTGTMVQVFQLAKNIPVGVWNDRVDEKV
jgi:uncharacterized protein YbcI